MNRHLDSKSSLSKLEGMISSDEDKEIEESTEYNPVDHIVNKFGGEIVPE